MIKFKYYTLLLFFVCTSIMYAQKFAPESYFGINGGMNASMVFFKPAIQQTYAAGKHFGISYRYISEKNLGLHTEINYIEKGWNENNGLTDIYTRRLNYLEVPFLSHIYAGDKIRFYFEIGPQISFLLNDKEILNFYVNPASVEQTFTLDNRFDYSGAAGFGLSFKIKSQTIQLGLRGSYSLNDIFSNDQRDYFDHSNNIVAQANLSWLIQTNYKRK